MLSQGKIASNFDIESSSTYRTSGTILSSAACLAPAISPCRGASRKSEGGFNTINKLTYTVYQCVFDSRGFSFMDGA